MDEAGLEVAQHVGRGCADNGSLMSWEGGGVPLFAQNYETVLHVPKAQLQSRLERQEERSAKGREKTQRLQHASGSPGSGASVVSKLSRSRLEITYSSIEKGIYKVVFFKEIYNSKVIITFTITEN